MEEQRGTSRGRQAEKETRKPINGEKSRESSPKLSTVNTCSLHPCIQTRLGDDALHVLSKQFEVIRKYIKLGNGIKWGLSVTDGLGK